MNLRPTLVPVLLSLLLGGCGVYMEARENVKPGGLLDKQHVDARAGLLAAEGERSRLAGHKAERDGELRRVDERIRAVRVELQQQDQALAAALESGKVTRQRYDALKREADSIRTESRALEPPPGRQNGGQADEAKERQLRELERRKERLSRALAEMTGG